MIVIDTRRLSTSFATSSQLPPVRERETLVLTEASSAVSAPCRV